ncbi:MAG: hypothetical protein ACRESJ_13105 [Pseudomonas sp.]|uniref:hypothetical protein n=1 Tax=Pseudomonas sp. TaxID=306 RepID=UPI003D6EDBE2
MTMAMTVVGYLCGLAIGGLIIWITVALRMAYTKMDFMLGFLKNCSLITTLAQLRQGGPLGKLFLVGSIAGVVTFTDFYIKRGSVDADDLRNFPAQLKRRLIVLQWVGMSLFGSIVIFVALAEVIKAYGF